MQSQDTTELKSLPITAATRGTLVLFPFSPTDPEEGKTYPYMRGYLDCREGRVSVSAFNHMTDEGRQMLTLSVGDQDTERLGGIILRAEEQDSSNGVWKPIFGKAFQRFGQITKSVKVESGYETVFALRLRGSRRRADVTGKPYLKMNVIPERSNEERDSSQGGCF